MAAFRRKADEITSLEPAPAAPCAGDEKCLAYTIPSYSPATKYQEPSPTPPDLHSRSAEHRHRSISGSTRETLPAGRNDIPSLPAAKARFWKVASQAGATTQRLGSPQRKCPP